MMAGAPIERNPAAPTANDPRGLVQSGIWLGTKGGYGGQIRMKIFAIVPTTSRARTRDRVEARQPA